MRIRKNVLELPKNSGSITLQNYDPHCYVPYEIFCAQSSLERANMATMFCATAQLDSGEKIRPWKELIDKVNKHVCGHSNYSDMRVLLKRNNLWNEQVEKYLPQVLESCPICDTTARPKSARKFSLSSMSREFNKIVSIHHLFLGDNTVFHIIDTKSIYSVGGVVENRKIQHYQSKMLRQLFKELADPPEKKAATPNASHKRHNTPKKKKSGAPSRLLLPCSDDKTHLLTLAVLVNCENISHEH